MTTIYNIILIVWLITDYNVQVKISFIMSSGELIYNDNSQSIKDRAIMNGKVVNQWCVLVLKPSACIISTFTETTRAMIL